MSVQEIIVIVCYCCCFRDKENDRGEVRVYPGKLQVSIPYCVVFVDSNTTVADLIREALIEFGFNNFKCEDFRCSEILLDRGGDSIYYYYSSKILLTVFVF